MKRLLGLFAVFGLLVAVPAHAARGETWIGGQLGASVPTGAFTQTVRTRFEGGVVMTYMWSGHVGIGLDFTHHGWASTDSATAGVAFFGPGTEVNFYAIQTTGHVLVDVMARGRVRPYAKAGAGLYSMGSRLRTPLGEFNSTESEFGYNVGAGVGVHVSPRWRIGVGATSHVVVTGTRTTFYTIGASLMRGMSLP